LQEKKSSTIVETQKMLIEGRGIAQTWSWFIYMKRVKRNSLGFLPAIRKQRPRLRKAAPQRTRINVTPHTLSVSMSGFSGRFHTSPLQEYAVSLQSVPTEGMCLDLRPGEKLKFILQEHQETPSSHSSKVKMVEISNPLAVTPDSQVSRHSPQIALSADQEAYSGEESQSEDMRRVYQKAREVFEFEDITEKWLHTPHSVLGGQSPLARVRSGEVKSVLDILGRMEFGVYY
jgi:putative toxin-antitoxin system antitoxin component (TIGR02293 family)